MMIDGLTKQQCKMMDILWSCQTSDDIIAARKQLPASMHQDFDGVLELAKVVSVDNFVELQEKKDGGLFIAVDMLEKIGVKCK